MVTAMQHRTWNGAAEPLSEQPFACARSQTLNPALRDVLRRGWRLMRSAASICAKATWAFLDFWNIPVLGPSEPQR